jgi:hypothetical protein
VDCVAALLLNLVKLRIAHGVVRKRLKLKLISKTVNGNRIYQIASEDRTKVSTRQAA